MPGAISRDDNEDTRNTERLELAAAVERLEDNPWEPVDDSGDGIVNLLFGGGVTSPKVQAEAYLASLEGEVVDPTLAMRRDVEQTLSAAWNVAHTGKKAVQSQQPIPADLRMVEAAIVEARQCRLVYAEAMLMMAKSDRSIQRDEVRRVKERFNQAILELGRTADVLHTRLDDGPVDRSYAETQSAF